MPRRPALSFLIAAAVLTLAACGSGVNKQAADTVGAGSPNASGSPAAVPSAGPARGPRAAPRWETVTTLVGNGSQQSAVFTILPGAVQWRVRFTCEGQGRFTLTTTPGPRRPGPLADGTCPGKEGFAIHTGEIRLGVEAPAAWTAIVDQQLDSPLDEPPLEVLAAATLDGEGSFYPLDKTGEGAARLYRTTDGRRFLRLESFVTSENTDLFVWLTDAVNPQDSASAFAAKRFVLGNLKSTVGNQNYELPADVGFPVHSVVVWCAPVAIAYTAANLKGST